MSAKDTNNSTGELKSKDFCGLEKDLYLAIGSKVMVVINTNPSIGMFNG